MAYACVLGAACEWGSELCGLVMLFVLLLVGVATLGGILGYVSEEVERRQPPRPPSSRTCENCAYNNKPTVATFCAGSPCFGRSRWTPIGSVVAASSALRDTPARPSAQVAAARRSTAPIIVPSHRARRSAAPPQPSFIELEAQDEILRALDDAAEYELDYGPKDLRDMREDESTEISDAWEYFYDDDEEL